jgi:hypothetical protein
MPPTADSSNSYVTVEEAASYFDTRLNSSAWTSALADDKARALIQASRIFDGYLNWLEEIDKAAAPIEVKNACCEMALVLLQDDTQVKNDMEGISEINLSGMSVKASHQKKSIIPFHVFRLIAHLVDSGNAGTIEIVRA